MATTAITTTMNGLESFRVKVSAQGAVVKLQGNVTINDQKKIIASNGQFSKVEDNSYVGTFSTNVNRVSYSDIEGTLMNECVALLNAVVTDIEAKATAGSITI